MPALKDLLKKKDKIAQVDHQPQQSSLAVPEFTFIRTTTESEEVIEPPSFDGDADRPRKSRKSDGKERKHRSMGFRRSAHAALTGDPTAVGVHEPAESSSNQLPVRPKAERRLSERLHLHRDRSRSASGESRTYLPDDLPEAPLAVVPLAGREGTTEEARELCQQREAQWEKRATMLAQANPLLLEEQARPAGGSRSRSRNRSISDQTGDGTIQDAIRLHESGDLEGSTVLFGRLADPQGSNNALAQVLYGLALRHGWGVPPEPEKAIRYLSLAASNSASIEEQALASGMKKGGAAKGELVLAIFELANCFRHGWGVKKDPPAARQYYETAANLGDTDAMEEAAWCYLEGFGGGKDKVSRVLILGSTCRSHDRSRGPRIVISCVSDRVCICSRPPRKAKTCLRTKAFLFEPKGLTQKAPCTVANSPILSLLSPVCLTLTLTLCP